MALALLVLASSAYVASPLVARGQVRRIAPLRSTGDASVWASMKNDELRAHLKRRNLKVSGNKTALVSRLAAADAAASRALAETPEASGASAPAADRDDTKARVGFIDATLGERGELSFGGGAAVACHVASTRLVAQESAARAPGAGGKAVLLLPDAEGGAYDAAAAVALADRLAFETDAVVVAPTPEDVDAYLALALRPEALVDALKACAPSARGATAFGLFAFGKFADVALAGATASFDAVVAWRPTLAEAALAEAAARASGAPLVVLAKDDGGADARAVALREGFERGKAEDYVVDVAEDPDALDEASDASLLAVAWLMLYLAPSKEGRTTGPRARAIWVED